jgi:hypothetical protein
MSRGWDVQIGRLVVVRGCFLYGKKCFFLENKPSVGWRERGRPDPDWVCEVFFDEFVDVFGIFCNVSRRRGGVGLVGSE